MPLFLIGLNHATAPVALRERFYVSGDHAAACLARCLALPGVDEAVVLSTCNRTEIITIADDPVPLVRVLEALADPCSAELRFYVYEDDKAACHLFRVACGLDSLMIGETQILKQVREALALARDAGAAGRCLIGLFEQAIATGRRARAETAISHGSVSIGHAGVALARRLFPDLSASPVLILGAGKMSELSARHLAAGGAQAIFVANRTFAHAAQLAEQLGGSAIRYDGLECALLGVDILISSTGAPHAVLQAAQVARVMRQRARPLCLIDIAVPRDIDPAVADIPGVYLYNIDDLRQVADDDYQLRQAEIPRVARIIDEETDAWRCRQAGLEASSLITALREHFEDVRQGELERLAHLLRDFSPDQRDAVEALTTALISKLLHMPTVRLKQLLAGQREPDLQCLLSHLFGLDDVTPTDTTTDTAPRRTEMAASRP